MSSIPTATRSTFFPDLSPEKSNEDRTKKCDFSSRNLSNTHSRHTQRKVENDALKAKPDKVAGVKSHEKQAEHTARMDDFKVRNKTEIVKTIWTEVAFDAFGSCSTHRKTHHLHETLDQHYGQVRWQARWSRGSVRISVERLQHVH